MGEAPLVVFSGGGTGGHLYPALALMDALRSRRPGLEVRFVGARRGLEARILPDRGLEALYVDVEGLSRKAPLRNVGVVWRLLKAVRQTMRRYREWRPKLVVVTGGYAGAPAGLAAVAMGIPLALQEQNSWPGVTTRLLARWASQIHLAFPEAAPRLPGKAGDDARHTGNPVRALPSLSRPEARRRLGIDEGTPTVLITGGSQGSRAINARLLEGIERFAARPPALQLYWATGPTHSTTVRTGLAELGAPPWVHAVPYIEDMTVALRAADIAVGRGGAMTTSEFLVAGLPAVVIPLPSAAADHQRHNARALSEAGVAIHLEEDDTSGEGLLDTLVELISSETRRAEMAERALARARPTAAADIAEDLHTLFQEAR